MTQGFRTVDDEADNAFLTQEVDNTLSQTCTVQEKISTPDAAGGEVTNYNDTATDVRCAVNVHTPDPEEPTADRLGGSTTYVIALEPGTAVTIGGRIVVDDGDTHEIKAIHDPVSVEVATTVLTVVEKR